MKTLKIPRVVCAVATVTLFSACAPAAGRPPAISGPDHDHVDRQCLVQGARAVLTGRVIDDSSGRSLPGVRIVLSPGGREAVTDSAGEYRIDELCGNRYSIRVESESWYQWSRPRIDVPRDSQRVRDVHVAPMLCTDLTPVGQLSGVVVNDSTGEPIEGAAVAHEDGNCGAMSDRQGRFTIRVMPAGDQRVFARRIGYAMLERDVRIPAGDVVNVRLELRPVATRLWIYRQPADSARSP